MSLVYIDTNVFLGFYQLSKDRLIVFKEILDRAQNVILTQQTVEEFRRNRIVILMRLADEFKDLANKNYSMPATAVIRELPGFEHCKMTNYEAKDAMLKIAQEFGSWIDEEASDLVLTEFNKLVNMATIVPTDASLIERAHTRKLLGQPPTSKDKYTIGDELNWESLLQGATDDVAVVSRDKSFLNNRSLMAAEFVQRTGKNLLLVTDSLSEGLKTVGKASEKIKSAEESLPSPASQTPLFDKYSRLRCLNCGSMTWNGARCFDCGFMDDD